MKPAYQAPESLDIIKYLYKNKVPVLGISFLVSVLVAIYTLFVPNRYTSSANLLPSQRPSLGLDLFSEDGGLSSLASSVLGGESEESNRYIILLSSTTTSTKVVERFDLINHYDVQGSDTELLDAIEILAERTSFEGMEEGNFIISVTDRDAQQAKEMADYYVELLNELNNEIVSKDARLYRQFIENRYQKALDDADSLKSEIVAFQNKYGVFQLPDQVSQYFALIGGLTAKQIESEITLDLLSQTVQKSSEAYKSAELEYKAITNNLAEIYADTSNQNLLLNFGNLSSVGADYVQLTLEAEIQAEIQKFLLPILEQAKMEEAKSLPIVSIVDAPIVALKKSYPRRSLIVIATGISSFILLVLYFIIKLSFVSNKEFFNYLRS